MSQSVSSQNQGRDAVKGDDVVQGRELEKVLCPHCKRTATNGIKCKGICVADSDY